MLNFKKKNDEKISDMHSKNNIKKGSGEMK